jgi:predicted dehydrogenase
MHFALLGDHPDGLAMARALVASGRHLLTTYHGPAAGAEALRRAGIEPRRVADLEEVLADPGVEAVIVAGKPADRPGQLRRALQSERHVLCVHPADQTPDIAYEAAMIQGDTKCVLLPLLPEGLHPGIKRLAELAAPPGTVRLVEMERAAPGTVLLGGDGVKVSFPGWDVLRVLGGEIAEVSAFAAREEASPDEPLLLAGRFERGGLFRAVLLPGEREARAGFAVVGPSGRAELTFPEGWPGPARLRWRDAAGHPHGASWPAWDPWTPLVEVFEAALAESPGLPSEKPAPRDDLGSPPAAEGDTRIEARRAAVNGPSPPSSAPVSLAHAPLTWQDEIRLLELDDAARRSVERRRANTLEYPEATEEVGFKGTMTLVGCSVLWGSLVLLILSRWVPWLGWVIVPLLVLFLALQLLRWVVR